MEPLKKKPYVPEGTLFYVTLPEGDVELAIYKNGYLEIERDSHFFNIELGRVLQHKDIKLIRVPVQ